MSGNEYRICLERVPPDHLLWRKRSYQRALEQRDRLSARMQSRAVPDGWQGFLVEVHPSLLWAVERPQLVLGTVEERVRLRPRDPSRLDQGSRGVDVVREATFVEIGETFFGPPLSVYTDDRLDVDVEALGRASFSEQARPSRPLREGPHPLPLHRHGRKKQRQLRREAADPSEVAAGRTFTTGGDLMSVSATHTGTPLSVHMLVRLLVPGDYPLAIARSFLGMRGSFSPDEIFTNRSAFGVCYDLLFCPRGDETG